MLVEVVGTDEEEKKEELRLLSYLHMIDRIEEEVTGCSETLHQSFVDGNPLQGIEFPI